MTRQLLIRIENHLSNNQSSSIFTIKSHRECKACRETMPAEQNFILKKYPFNTETKPLGTRLIICLKPSSNIKTWSFTWNGIAVVVVTQPYREWGHGRRPWSFRRRATPQGLDQRSQRDKELPKSKQHRVRS